MRGPLATCGGLDDGEESGAASVTDPSTTSTLNPGVDCSVASGAVSAVEEGRGGGGAGAAGPAPPGAQG